ncbi:MAG: hypothetical protein JWN95_1705 [Frankiales bacterium]|nr:hypothetical protein [Frankiales bacterium]
MSSATQPRAAGREQSGHRRRNSADSRSRLLLAAAELFAERGYERTTVREVGLRADVDPAMIARYFGSKAALYLETLRQEGQPATKDPLDITDAAALQAMFDRVGENHPTPTMYAAVRRHDDAELHAAAMRVLRTRLVEPAERTASAAGLESPELRAEIITAALAGIVLSRASKALPRLADAPSADVGRLVAKLLGGLLDASGKSYAHEVMAAPE